MVSDSCGVATTKSAIVVPLNIPPYSQEIVLPQPVKQRKLPNGVYPSGSKFTSSIRICGKLYYLGTFDTIKDAVKAYNEAARNALR